jgi:hypothetical protein
MYPQHQRLKEVQPISQAIHEFVQEFLVDKEIFLAKYLNAQSERIVPVNKNLTGMVAEFLEIDLKALEEEKLHMLLEQRKLNENSGDQTTDAHGSVGSP